MTLIKIAILNENFCNIERICELLRRLYVAYEAGTNESDIETLNGDTIIDNVMKYYFSRNVDSFLPNRKELINFVRRINPQYESDYVEEKLKEIHSREKQCSLIVVHTVKTAACRNLLSSQGFHFFRLNYKMDDRLKVAKNLYPKMEESDLLEFVDVSSEEPDGDIVELDGAKSHAAIVTQIFSCIL